MFKNTAKKGQKKLINKIVTKAWHKINILKKFFLMLNNLVIFVYLLCHSALLS